MWIVCPKDYQRLLPIGATGEIVVDGPILAHGYLGQPEMTAESFLSSAPFIPQGHRLYRTGDMACYDADGNFHFRGRSDTQVKVNGQRVDVAELETHILRLKASCGVQHAAVVSFMRRSPTYSHTGTLTPERSHMSNSKELAAFICFDDTKATSTATGQATTSILPPTDDVSARMIQIKLHLEDSVPPYMLPAIYLPVAGLPTTTSSKLDRKLLKQTVESLSVEELHQLSAETLHLSPDADGSLFLASSASCSGLPSDALELELTQLWNLVLRRDSGDPQGGEGIRTTDNFFALGGNSLSAMQLVWQARAKKLLFSVSDLYSNPTISQLAETMRTRTGFIGGESESDSILTSSLLCGVNHIPEPFSLITSEEKTVVERETALHIGVSTEDTEDIYPATHTQVGLLLQTEYRPGLWEAHDRWELPENLDIDRFLGAWELVVQRCPVLRTRLLQIDSGTLPLSNAKYYQVALRSGTSSIGHFRQAQHSHHVDGEELCQHTMGFGKPLSVYRIANGVFEWTRHHAIYDDWSTRLILGQVADIYGSKTPRETLPYSCYVRKLQHMDHKAAKVFWLSELAGIGADCFRACSFPCNGALQSSQNPSICEPATQSQITRDIALRSLGDDDDNGVVGVTVAVATALEAAWALVLSAYSGSQDILFGVVQSGRTSDVDLKIPHIVGPTISIVPRRVRLDDQLTLGDLLRACQQRAQAAAPFEASGLQAMSRVLAREHASLKSLLVIQAGVEATNDDAYTALGLRPASEGLGPAAAGHSFPFGLVLECVMPHLHHGRKRGHVGLIARFDNGFIEGDTVDRLLSHFEHTFNQLVLRHPETALGSISIWGSDLVKSQMAHIYENTPPAAVEACVHDLVARNWQTGSHIVDHPAVLMRTGGCDVLPYLTLTYRDLEKYSRVVCARIITEAKERFALATEDSLGVPFVAICFEKSHWTIVAMIGALRAGAAIVLLDPELPRHRLFKTVQKTNAALVLVSSATRYLWDECLTTGRETDDFRIKTLLMTFPPEDEFEGASCEKTQTAFSPSKPSDACYCVFTSGSTAEPKGVVVQHRAICTSAVFHGRETGLNHSSRVLQFSSYSFDVAIDEILTTLIHGGCVCVVGEEDRKSPTDLTEAMREMDVNVALLTPAVLQILEPDSVPCLKTLVVGGSPMNSSLVSLWKERVHLVVAYGPSECSVTATMNSDVSNSSPGTIGQPIGCRGWVLGTDLFRNDEESQEQSTSRLPRLVPLGCVGELVIEGNILADGYIVDPKLTTERFFLASDIAGGFCEVTGCHPETRLYRTGDLVRQSADGSLLFIGRADSQVKVGGVRVELGVIEHCISEIDKSGIRDAVVVCPGKGPLSDRLVVVVQLQDPAGDFESNLSPYTSSNLSESRITFGPNHLLDAARDRIKEQLPASHVPTIWSTVIRMPLLRSDKVDRSALRKQLEDTGASSFPQDDQGNLGCSSLPTATSPRDSKQRGHTPETSLEARIRGLMGQVLGQDISLVPDSCSFTRLGGDSLLAMGLVALARTAGLPGITVAKLLGNTSIAELFQSVAAFTATKVSETGKSSPITPLFSGTSEATTGSETRIVSPITPLMSSTSEPTYEQHRIALTFAQRMFFSHYPFGPGYFNQSVSVSICSQNPALMSRVGRELVERHLLSLVKRHDALRSRFRRRRNPKSGPEEECAWHWEGVVTDNVASSLRFRAHVLDSIGPGQTVDIAQVAMETHQSLNVSSGPLFAADLLYLPGGSIELLLVAHHLVVDIVSWTILLGDLEALMLGVELDPAPGLLALETGVLDDMQVYENDADDLESTKNEEAMLEFWGMKKSRSSMGSKPPAGTRSKTFSISLVRDESRLLSGSVASIDQLEIGDVVEAVVAKAFADVCRQRGRVSSPLIYVEDHGRDLNGSTGQESSSARVGWLTRVRPVYVSILRTDTSLLEAIWDARTGRRGSPGPPSGTKESIPLLPLELVINYTGRQLVRSGVSSESSFRPLQPVSATTTAELATVPDMDPFLTPLALIEVLASLHDQKGLEFTVTYDTRVQNVDTLRSCMDSCVRLLRDQVVPYLPVASVSGWHSCLVLLPGLGDETANYRKSRDRRLQMMDKLGLASMDEVETVRACSAPQRMILSAQAQAQTRVPDSLLYYVRAVWQVSLDDKTNSSETRPALDLARLERACEKAIRQHPSLRTALVQLPDMVQPIQVVLRHGCADTILRATPECRPDDAPVRPAGTAARLELRVNHALFDGLSSAILLRDIDLAYSGEALDPDSPLVIHRYFSYLEKAQEQIRMADAYWDQRLRDVQPCRLPPLGSDSRADKQRDVDPTSEFFDVCLNVGGEKATISKWCRRFGATAAVAIHTAWAMALNAYCSTDTEAHNVCFIWFSSGRDLPVAGLEKAVGMFANLLVCRAQIGPDMLVREAVSAMSREMAEGLQHQIGRPKVIRSGEPLCDTVVAVQSLSTPEDAPSHGRLCFRQIEGLECVEYALVLNIAIAKDNESMDCRITYDPLRISETASRAFFAVFELALTVLITTEADSVAKLADINLFPPLHHELAHNFNIDDSTNYYQRTSRPSIHKDGVRDELSARGPPTTTIISLFSEQVRTRPNAVAVEAWDASLTFSQLEKLSGSFCRHLVDDLGLSCGDSVVFICEKSAWVVVAMLAALRAGAACAFLSPTEGALRLRNMMEQMRARTIIASSAHKEKAEELLRDCGNRHRKVIVLDPDADIFKDAALPPVANVSERCRPEHVAFVLFTSGSTGSPKGIRLTHSSLCLSVLNYTRCLGISDQSRLLQFSAYTFDLGIGDMLASLVTGAVLCVPSEADRLGDLNGAIDRFQASFVMLTPSVAAFLRPDRLKNCSLKGMALIGELATSELYKRWHDRIRLFNAYGPAECSVLSTVRRIESANDNPAIIGTPLAPHCRIWLVDPADSSRLVPVGSCGEILIEGQHVALGYLNNPDKTAQAFIAGDKAPLAIRPFLPGARLYLTGDLARLVPHQGLVYLGRKDMQMKLRGQRIEVGEIEFHLVRRVLEGLPHLQQPTLHAYLAGSPCVMASVVVARQASGEDALVAYVSVAPEGGNMAGEGEDWKEMGDPLISDSFISRVRNHLKLDLPPYMVPSIILPVRRLPQTLSGKVDRKKLQQHAVEFGSCSRLQSSPRVVDDLDSTQTQIQASSVHRSPQPAEALNKQKQRPQLEPQALCNTSVSSQESLRSLWAKVLKLDAASISPEDDFFSSGGDSILAMRLAAGCLEQGIRLPVLTIMRFPILSSMAAQLEHIQKAGRGVDSGKLRPLGLDRNGNSDISTSPEDPKYVDSAMNSGRPCVRDEFRATNFQQAMLIFNMAPARGFLNYFILKLDPSVDAGRLERACRSLLARHSVLRSSFRYNGTCLVQRIRPSEAVDLQKLNIGSVDKSLLPDTKYVDIDVATLIESDRNAPLAWDDCLTKIFIVSHRVTGSLRLILRLSHALYDGICLSILWNDLSSAYGIGGLPNLSIDEPEYGFVKFASRVAGDIPEIARQFWRGLLHGSDLTPVIPQAQDPPQPDHIKEVDYLQQSTPPRTGIMQGRSVSVVPIRSLAMPSVTPASVLKAAWAVVLANRSHPSRGDVVFGHIVSCRETLDASMQDAVGAFLNCIPVRVVVPGMAAGATGFDTASTVRRLALQVHAQHVAGLPHHGIGLGQLTQSGIVGWKHARFGSVVQYQNLPPSKAAGLSRIESGPLKGTSIEVNGRAGAYADVWITAVPRDASTIEIELRYDKSVVGDDLGGLLLEGLCTVLHSLCVKDGDVE